MSDAAGAGRNGGASAEEAQAAVELARAEARAQAAAARRARGPAAVEPVETRYIGMATRALAFVIDVAIVNIIAVLTGAAVDLVMSTLHFNSSLKDVVRAILAVLYLAWGFAYFVVFWSSTGQTPGNRLLQIRVVDAGHGGSIQVRRAALRLVALTAGVMALGLGEWIALLDDRSRTFQDRVARTYVVDAPVYTANDARRMAQQAAVAQAAREEGAPQG
ncbi:MAG TPA: RDD family protein [Solirubrobacteraceae bacterium]|nr:RDD family protein [Solirubrobacteraceae bacterium]